MKGTITPVSAITEAERDAMFALMDICYDGCLPEVFRRDLAEKDYVLLLREEGELVGFTTQKLLTVRVGDEDIPGVFSGDTVIRPDHWGESEIFRAWAQFWFPFAEQYREFYWFLICKGYKTYRILPLFWAEFYPTFRRETPARERAIIDGYARALYGSDYDPASGVIRYSHEKDRLRAGVADISESRLKNPDIAFFAKANPGHILGHDLACLARIDRAALKPRAPGLLGI